MKIFKFMVIVFFYIFAISLQAGHAIEVKAPSFTVDYKPAGEPDTRFNKGMGQCVDFVKQSRSDLPWDIARLPEKLKEPGKATYMPSVAKEKGFVVNNIPREGAVLVMPDVKIIKTGEITGHVAIVTKVEESQGGFYTLTIRDANAKNDIKYDKADKIVQGSTIMERTVTYDAKEKKIVDGILKEQSNIVFIHEKKNIYNDKQKAASEYVTQIFKDLGKEPSAEEKRKYAEKLFSGSVPPEQFKNAVKVTELPAKQATAKIEDKHKAGTEDKGKEKLGEAKEKTTSSTAAASKNTPSAEDESIKILKERVKILKEEIKKAQGKIQSKTEAWNKVKEDFIKIGITIFNYIMKAKIPTGIYIPEGFFPSELQASVLNTLDKDNLTGRNQIAGQDKLNPTKVEFTQTFDGLFTQSADSPGSRNGTHSGTLTDGTRVNVIGDSRPGDFTGSITNGKSVGEPGYTPATHNNSAFSGSSVGVISAKGFKEGDLKGSMTVTIPAGTQTATVTGNITIKTDGSLSMPSYSGPVTVNATGEKVGTMSGSWSQSKTR